MEALGERAWGVFESQWLSTIRRDEGEAAAQEVSQSVESISQTGPCIACLSRTFNSPHDYPFMHIHAQAAAVLAGLGATTPARRARILTHQLASLTLLGYTASLSAHKVRECPCACTSCLPVHTSH
jgi:hypothetical protein